MIAEIEKGAERRGGWDRKSLQALIYKKQESFVCECETKVGKFGLSISHTCTHTHSHIFATNKHTFIHKHTHIHNTKTQILGNIVIIFCCILHYYTRTHETVI